MRAYSSYGRENVPRIVTITSKTRCVFCDQSEEGEPAKPSAYMKKGDRAVLFVYNAGPTGRAFVCIKHAKQLGKELTELLANE